MPHSTLTISVVKHEVGYQGNFSYRRRKKLIWSQNFPVVRLTEEDAMADAMQLLQAYCPNHIS